MDNAGQFGGTLFSLAASVMTDLIHHDPLVFPALDQAGLPQAFIDSIKASAEPLFSWQGALSSLKSPGVAAFVARPLFPGEPCCTLASNRVGMRQWVTARGLQAGIVPAGDAIACVPTALVAVCLNSNGAHKVKASHALDSLVPVLTTPAYVKALSVRPLPLLPRPRQLFAMCRHMVVGRNGGSGWRAGVLQGETLGALGTGLDELMRHVPTLRDSVIEVFIKILKALIALGGGHPIAPAPEGLPQAEAPSADAAEDAAQPMETDASTASEVGPSTAAAASGQRSAD